MDEETKKNEEDFLYESVERVMESNEDSDGVTGGQGAGVRKKTRNSDEHYLHGDVKRE